MKQYVAQQLAMLRFWWRKPAKGTFDMTPATPPRKIFGSHLPSRNGAFRPTLMDVLTGKARRAHYLTK